MNPLIQHHYRNKWMSDFIYSSDNISNIFSEKILSRSFLSGLMTRFKQKIVHYVVCLLFESCHQSTEKWTRTCLFSKEVLLMLSLLLLCSLTLFKENEIRGVTIENLINVMIFAKIRYYGVFRLTYHDRRNNTMKNTLNWCVPTFQSDVAEKPLFFIIPNLDTFDLLSGIFTFMIALACFSIAAWLIDGFRLRFGIWSAVLGAFVLTIINNIIYKLLGV